MLLVQDHADASWPTCVDKNRRSREVQKQPALIHGVAPAAAQHTECDLQKGGAMLTWQHAQLLQCHPKCLLSFRSLRDAHYMCLDD